MNSPTQDVSLYEIALDSEESPAPLQLSPATLKSIVGAFIDILVEQNLPATIWAKLPRDEAWQSEIRRYSDLGISPQIYLLNNYRDQATEEIGGTEGRKGSTPAPAIAPNGTAHMSQDERLLALAQAESVSRNDQLLRKKEGTASTQISESVVSVQLALESQLKREHFLLCLSPRFCGLVLAHRPRSMRQAKPENNSAQTANNKSSNPDDESLERKQPLLAFCSFEQSTIQRVLDGIKQAVISGSLQSAIHQAAIASSELLISWDQQLSDCFAQSLDATLLSQLFGKQIQRQEEIWHRTNTYRKQAEAAESLQLQNEELLNVIHRKDEFLSMVGQELRTPLTNMKTALTLLNSPSLKPAQRQRYMQVLTTECDRQGSLVTSLQNLVQLDREIENAVMQPIHLAEIVPGVVSTYQPLAQEKGIMLAYTVPEDLPPVSCLSAWLKQIVINLLHNGIKFTPQAGQVWVRAKLQGEYAQLEFRDTGIGIPTSEIPKIFDRFYRVRHVAGEDPGGAGLGLTIVQQILLRCGGSISVKSKLGEGSTFNVLLPIYKNNTTDGGTQI